MSLQSDQINELMTALSKAQGQMSHAIKDSTNPHFKSKYADLASVWQACREPLANNGLAVTQTLDFAGEKQALVTTLGHTSGQWIKSIMVLPVCNKPQETGSALSYFRRYSLASMVGVYQDDDDGEQASKPYRSPPVVKIDDRQVEEICNWLDKFPEKRGPLLKRYDVERVDDLPAKSFDFIINTFKTMKKEDEDET